MNRDELTKEECRATWREEAKARANQEAKESGLTGEEALQFVRKRMPNIYDELREIGEGGIS